jgi:T4 RnlA family RNA ligase
MSTNLDSKLFKIIEKDGLRLVIPKHSAAVSNEAWTPDNLWWRSRVECIKSGDTISQGFCKFFNLGQGPDGLRIDAETILTAIRSEERVVATLKYDGSCLIRSVYKGEVLLRTRGSLDFRYHDEANNEMGVFLDKYPKLWDSEWEPNRSLLFEWLTPDFQIVIKYEEADLRLLAAVDHGHRHFSHLRYLTMAELEPIAAECGIPLTEYHVINSVKDWHHFYRDVIDHKEIEGYVLRLADEQNLVKVKSAPYLAKHGIKSNLSFKSMVEFWLQHGQEMVYDAILGQLEKMYDEEIVMWALPFVDNLFVAVEAWEKALSGVQKVARESRHWPRKDFAIEMGKRYADDRVLFGLAMQLWQDKPVEDKMIRNYMMRFDKGIKGQFD